MSEDASRRRSVRVRTTNPRYSENFADLDLGSSDSEQAFSLPDADDINDDDFDEAKTQESGGEEADDDVEADSDEASVSIGDVREDVDIDRPPKRTKAAKVTKKRPLGTTEEILPRPRNKIRRGLKDISRQSVRRTRIEHTYGHGDDLIPYLKNRDAWQDDSTLPSHFAPSFYHTEKMRERESSDGWDWYVSGGGAAAFERRQETQPIDVKNAHIFLPDVSLAGHMLLIGPPQQQKPVTLKVSGSMPLGKSGARSTQEDGYILNVGARVQSLDWLANNDTEEQYLVISALTLQQRPRAEDANDKLQNQHPPAFTTAPRHPTAIQIWCVTKEEARLSTAICLDCGDPKQLRWCPVPGPAGQDSPGGLLAGIFRDGGIRVFDLKLRKSTEPDYVHLQSFAFESFLPQGVLPTAIAWLSSRALAVGCSDGHVAIFDLASHLRPDRGVNTGQPRPWFYHPVHPTYILSLTSCYPSSPHLLISSSYDGTIRLTDVRNPTSDTVSNPRCRIGTSAVAWSDRLQTAISVDEVGLVKGNTLRRFFQTLELGKLTAQVADMRTSPVHGSILTGGLDGRTYISGPMRRVSNSVRADVWRQCWFEYTWRRPLEKKQIESLKANKLAEAARTGHENQDEEEEEFERLRQPMSRFLDGFKPEQVMGQGIDGRKLLQAHHTIYEEQTAATQVAWNPNVKFGGWAAAGMGSGLVRIQDLTYRKIAKH